MNTIHTRKTKRDLTYNREYLNVTSVTLIGAEDKKS